MRKMVLGNLIIIIMLFSFCGQEKKVKLTLPSIFNDNMVVQRNTSVPFWGQGNPGTQIKIKASWGNQVRTQVNKDGSWETNIPTPSAGGPFQITVENTNQKTIFNNVMSGEVWLCSGQSNMEMPLKGWPPRDTILNSEKEINQADYPQIRLFTVEKKIATQPKKNCQGSWQLCKPSTADDFSATAYFFGRKLYQELKIPIGLIHSSWGGTPAEAWTEKKYLSPFKNLNQIVKNLGKYENKLNRLNTWLEKLHKIDMNEIQGKNKWGNLDFKDQKYSSPAFDDNQWPEMDLPVQWEETKMGNFDGVVWFRRSFKMPPGWEDKVIVLELSKIDDMDATYLNGQRIGATLQPGNWQKKRTYQITSDIIKQGKNYIAVRVMDTGGGGGIYGQTKNMKIYPLEETDQTITLAGKWKYLPVANYKNDIFYVYSEGTNDYFSQPEIPFGINSDTPTVLFNGMINPLIPFRIKGVIWYQGESNTDRPYQYRELFPAMIKSWRDKWKQGPFPFYFVQIAPFSYSSQTNSQLLREAQLKTLAFENTGMVVTTDIGNPDNIHPANKQDVGKRLALWALAKNYGYDDLAYSGPIYQKMKIEDDKIRIFFDLCDSGLMVKGQRLTEFQIAGKDKKFHPARTKIEGKTALVWHPDVKKPVAVRFGWNNTPEPNLFNKAGLPASPFRTDSWKK